MDYLGNNIQQQYLNPFVLHFEHAGWPSLNMYKMEQNCKIYMKGHMHEIWINYFFFFFF